MNRAVEDVLRRYPPLGSPYLRGLQDGTLTRAQFLTTQKQFRHAVAFFPRAMAALLARMPEPGVRMPVARNLWEEHGEGNVDLFHTTTFDELLVRLGGDAARVTAWPCVAAFNLGVLGACTVEAPSFGAAALGMVERMFVDIAAHVGACIVSRGWLPGDRVVHYPVHEKLDVRHAQDLLDVAQACAASEVGGEANVQRGMEYGAHVFTALFDGLHAARDRET